MARAILVIVLLIFINGSTMAESLPSLRATPQSMLFENNKADEENLSRLRNDVEVRKFARLGLLVRPPETKFIAIDHRLDSRWRWIRPWVSSFLFKTGKGSFSECGIPIQINSALRSVERQKELVRVNPNAAPAVGPKASPHLTGSTIDLSKLVMNSCGIGWMRHYLRTLKRYNKIDAIEEMYQAVFHIMVFKPIE